MRVQSPPSVADMNSDNFLQVFTPTPPLLGSPYSCGIWSPARNRLVTTPSSLSVSSGEDFPVEIGGKLPEIGDDPAGDLFYTFKGLEGRLDVLLAGVKKMQADAECVSKEYQKLLSISDRNLRKLGRTREEIADKLYLDHLICLLNGDLRHLPLTKWPFKITSTDSEPFNLVI